MQRSKEEWISRRAYALWEAEGRPQGRDLENWLQASAEFEQLERTKASHDGKEVLRQNKARAGRLFAASNTDRPAGSRKASAS
jgi:hypothetical protein